MKIWVHNKNCIKFLAICKWRSTDPYHPFLVSLGIWAIYSIWHKWMNECSCRVRSNPQNQSLWIKYSATFVYSLQCEAPTAHFFHCMENGTLLRFSMPQLSLRRSSSCHTDVVYGRLANPCHASFRSINLLQNNPKSLKTKILPNTQ